MAGAAGFRSGALDAGRAAEGGFDGGAPLSNAVTCAEGAGFVLGFWARMRVLRTNGPQVTSSTGRNSQAVTLCPLTNKPPLELLS